MLKNNHPYLNVSKDLAALGQLLAPLGITCFSYLKNLYNGIQINLSTQPQWIEDYYKYDLFQSSQYDVSPNKIHEGISLWSSQSGSEVILHGKRYFNSDYGISIVKRIEAGYESFFFSGAADAEGMHNFFVNNIDLLEHFILYFKEKFFKEIKKLETSPDAVINKAVFVTSTTVPGQQTISDQIKEKFLQDTKIRKLYHNTKNSFIQFSPQQTQCIKHLISNKTATEIAALMSINERTVVSYLGAIKDKLKCNTKIELFNLLSEYQGLL